MVNKQKLLLLSFITLFSALVFSGCSCTSKKQYLPDPLIDLDQIKVAFVRTKAKNFPSWINTFEKRVNEIYLKGEIVSVDARFPQKGKFQMDGFVERNKIIGYQRGQDHLLFRIRQVDYAKNPRKFTYVIEDDYGWIYHKGVYPAQSQGMALGIPIPSIGAERRPHRTWSQEKQNLQKHRKSYRKKPAFGTRKSKYEAFRRKYATNSQRRKAYRRSSGRKSRKRSGKKRYRSKSRSRRRSGKR